MLVVCYEFSMFDPCITFPAFKTEEHIGQILRVKVRPFFKNGHELFPDVSAESERCSRSIIWLLFDTAIQALKLEYCSQRLNCACNQQSLLLFEFAIWTQLHWSFMLEDLLHRAWKWLRHTICSVRPMTILTSSYILNPSFIQWWRQLIPLSLARYLTDSFLTHALQ